MNLRVVSSGGPASVLAGVLDGNFGGFLRLAAVTLGGLLVLQSSDELNAGKVVYLVVAAVALAVAAWRLGSVRAAPAFLAARGLLVAMLVLLATIAVSLPVALAHGVSPTTWLRDATAYGLFAVAALFAVDAYAADRRGLLTLAVALGALATASYVIEWLAIRSIADVPLERLVLPSGALASMFLVLTSAFAFRSERHWIWWAAAAGATLGLLLILGTRSRLPFVLLPVVLGLLAGGPIWRRIAAGATQFAIAALVVAALPVLENIAVPDAAPGSGTSDAPTEVIGRRLGSIDDLADNPAGDPSMRERLSQTVGSWNLFVENPVLGAGPGKLITWSDYAGREQRTWTVDSPIAILAKFGLMGLAAGSVWVIAFVRFAATVLPRLRGSPESLVLVGEIVVLAYATLFAPPMQDKGTAIALMLVLAIVLHRAYGPSVAAGASPNS